MRLRTAHNPPWMSTPNTPGGGNLVDDHPVHHFLFPEQPQQFGAQITDTGRSPASVSATSAPAAPPRGLDPASVPLALPFLQVNYVSHVDGSFSVGRTEHTRSFFA